MKRNLFIALEGIDGSGKSTQAKLLAAKLEANGHKVYTTFEPTGGVVGVLLRSILKGTVKADERVIAGLFVADRLDHLVNKIDGLLDKMKEGYTVITDRYYFSSYAYHSVHLPMEWVVQANALSAGLLRPDLNVFIDIAPEVAMQRINKGRHGAELYETLENLAAVRQKYFEAFDLLKNEEKVSVIKGEGTPDETAENIWQALGNL